MDKRLKKVISVEWCADNVHDVIQSTNGLEDMKLTDDEAYDIITELKDRITREMEQLSWNIVEERLLKLQKQKGVDENG